MTDCASRRILSYRLSNTLTTEFCGEALEDSVRRHGVPEIVNTDQGSQFTSDEFVGVVAACGAAQSKGGKSPRRANVFIESLWRSLKYEEVYLQEYRDMRDARSRLDRYLVVFKG